MSTLQAIIAALAVYRLTALVVQDRVTRALRARAIRWAYRHSDGPSADDYAQTWAEWDELGQSDKDAPGVAYLLTCWWCAGLWVCSLWTVFYWAAPVAAWWVSLPLALSAALVLLERVESLLRARSGA